MHTISLYAIHCYTPCSVSDGLPYNPEDEAVAQRDLIFLSIQDDSSIWSSYSLQLRLHVVLKLTHSKLLQRSCEVALE